MAETTYVPNPRPVEDPPSRAFDCDCAGGSGSGSGSGSAGLTGAGSPQGVVTAAAGTTYYNTSDSSFWVKGSGSGNTGWVPLIS